MGSVFGLAGESGPLPRAEYRGGMQGSRCLRSTLAVCPGDKPRSEFTTRPPRDSDKGTHAQRGQGTRQDKPNTGPTRKPPLSDTKPKQQRPEEPLWCSQSSTTPFLKRFTRQPSRQTTCRYTIPLIKTGDSKPCKPIRRPEIKKPPRAIRLPGAQVR